MEDGVEPPTLLLERGQWHTRISFLSVWISEIGEDYAAIKWQRGDVVMPADTSDECIPEFLMSLELEPDQRERDIENALKPKKVAEQRYASSPMVFPVPTVSSVWTNFFGLPHT